MTSQFRAELLKIRSTRTTAGVVLGMIAIILLFSLLTGLLTKAPNLDTTGDQRNHQRCHHERNNDQRRRPATQTTRTKR